MNDIEKSIKINGIKSGALLGVCLTMLSVFSFYAVTVPSPSPVLFVAAPIFFSLLLPILLVLLLCFKQRKNIGGFWSFKQATTGIFIMGVIAFIIQVITINLLFAKLVEPNMNVKMFKARKATTTMVMQKAKIDPKLLEAKIAEIDTEFNSQKEVTIGNVIQNTAIAIIFIFVLSLIFGALMKKDPPVYETVN